MHTPIPLDVDASAMVIAFLGAAQIGKRDFVHVAAEGQTSVSPWGKAGRTRLHVSCLVGAHGKDSRSRLSVVCQKEFFSLG